ncbi:MAG: hypothetical protein P1P71_07635 [Anaerosomatales bacterium]|nr:hypothetical protein [Anaerosomatales bacterium]
MSRVVLPGDAGRDVYDPDRGVVIAHLAVPVVFAAIFAGLLAEGWSWPLFATFLPLLAVGLRPAVWGIAARMRESQKIRSVRYLERRDNAANVSLVTMSITGLAIMDVFRLPGSPHWLNQPTAALLLAAVAVYLVWLATYSSVPIEVKRGWTILLGGKDER